VIVEAVAWWASPFKVYDRVIQRLFTIIPVPIISAWACFPQSLGFGLGIKMFPAVDALAMRLELP
jgi:hypothetical protein